MTKISLNRFWVNRGIICQNVELKKTNPIAIVPIHAAKKACVASAFIPIELLVNYLLVISLMMLKGRMIELLKILLKSISLEEDGGKKPT